MAVAVAATMTAVEGTTTEIADMTDILLHPGPWASRRCPLTMCLPPCACLPAVLRSGGGGGYDDRRGGGSGGGGYDDRR